MTNVMLVLADDMRTDLLPYAPFLNGVLRPGGTHFTDMQCNVPVCQAARAGILTGQYALRSANGIYQNGDGNIPTPATNSLPVWLAPHTASNGMFGKYLHEAQSTVQPGWDTWRVMNSSEQNSWAGGYTIFNGTTTIRPNQHQLIYLSGEVKKFITTAPEPWFCYFAPTNPHVNVPAFKQNPLPASISKYGHVRWNFDLLSDQDLATKPSWIRAQPALTDYGKSVLRHDIRQQIREVRDLDDALADIYATLQTSAKLDNTVILFATDSGVHFGEQNFPVSTSQKDSPYDVSSRVPGIGFGPGFTPGTNVDTITSLQDLTATITAILGATPSLPLDGTDLRTFLTTPDPNRAVLYERKRSTTLPDAQGIFTHTRKLTRYSGYVPTTGQAIADPDRYEAYDRDTDSNEHVNWANDGSRIDEKNTLETQLNQLLT